MLATVGPFRPCRHRLLETPDFGAQYPAYRYPLGKATVQGNMPKQKVTSLGQSHRPGQYAETKGYLPWAKPPSRAVCRNKRLPPLGKATVQGSMPKQKVTSLSNASSATLPPPRMARGQSGSLRLLCTTLSFATPCRFIPALSSP